MRYKVELRGKKLFSILQENDDLTFVDFGTPTITKFRTNYTVPSIGTDPLTDKMETYWQMKWDNTGTTPTGTVGAELRKVSDNSLVATAPETYNSTSIAGTAGSVTTKVKFTFDLDEYEFEHELDYNFRIVFTVTVTTTNGPFQILFHSSEQESQTATEQEISTVWTAVTGDPWMQFYSLRPKEFDITDAVREIKIDTGKSNVDGQYVEGQCDLTIDNKNGEFSPDNTSSIYYEYFDLMAQITVTVFLTPTTYDFFQGFIVRIRPDMLFEKRDVFVFCSDRFFVLKDHKITVAMGGNKPVHEVIEQVFDEVKLHSSRYVLDTSDGADLKSKTWTDENAISILDELVEAGQHHHFVDGAGIYQFHANTWLGGDVPTDYTWESGDCGDVDDFKVEYDIKGLFNRFRVEYPTDQWSERTNDNSIVLYGQRDLELSNDLILNVGSAEEVARTLQSLFSKRIQGANFTLENRLPEALDIDIGTVIDFTDALSSITNIKFIVFGLKRTIRRGGDYTLELRTKRQYSPPFFHEVSDPNAAVGFQQFLVSGAGSIHQQFTVPEDGVILQAICKIEKLLTWASGHNLVCSFWEDNVDTLGLSMGYLGLAFTSPTPTTEEITFSMITVGDTFVIGKKYWITFVVVGAEATKKYQLWGRSDNPEPTLKAAYNDHTGPGFTLQSNIDYWWKFKIYPEG